MADANENVKVQFGAKTSGAQRQIELLGEGIAHLNAPIRNVINSATELGEAVLAGFAVERVSEFFEKIGEVGEQMKKMEQQTGMTAEQLSVLNAGARTNGATLDDYRMAFTKLQVSMSEAQRGNKEQLDAFSALGIKSTDLTNTWDVLQKVADKFKDSPDGVNKTAVAFALLGRGSASLIPMLNQGAEGMAKFKQIAQDTNTYLDEGMVKTLDDMNEKFDKFHLSMDGLKDSLGVQFAGVVGSTVDIVTHFAESLGNMVKNSFLLQSALAGINLVLKVFDSALVLGMGGISQILAWIDEWAMKLVNLGVLIGNVSTQLAEFAAHPFDGAVHAKALADIQASYKKFLTDNQKINADSAEQFKKNAQLLVDQLNDIWGKDGAGGKPKGKVGGLGDKSDRVGKWEAELDAMLMAQHKFGDDALAEEISYWNQKLSIVKKGSDEYNAIIKKLYDFEKQQQQATVAQFVETIAQKQAAAGTDFTKVMALEYEKLNFLKGIYAQDSKQYQAALREKTTLENQQMKQMQDKYAQTFKSVFSSFNDAIKGMINGTSTWQQAVVGTLESLVMKFVEFIEEMVAKWAAHEIAKTVISAQEDAARATGTVAAAATDATVKGVAARTSIATDAAAAYAGVFANMAPYLGPLAAGPAAAAYANVMATEALIPSFAVGAWELPGDTMANVHKGEMIIPQTFAEGIRSGSLGGGGGDIHIHAVDAQSFNQLLNRNPALLTGAMRRQMRGGAFTKQMKGR